MAFTQYFQRIWCGLNIVPKSSSDNANQGDIEVLSTDAKIHYHNGTTTAPVVTETHASQGTNRLQNKDLDAGSVVVVDPSDTTKQLGWQTSGATTSTKTTVIASQTVNRSLTLPDATDTLVGRATTDTLTNKTLTSPTINTPTLVGSGGTLTLPAGPDTLVARATTDTLTNKILTSPTINSGTINTPTLVGSVGTLTLPAGPDTLVGRATTDTLTNKTIAAGSNTVTGLTNTNLSGTAGITYANLSVASSIKSSDVNSQAATNGQVLTANGSGGASWITSSATTRNFLINSNFDFWQRGTSVTVATATSGYGPDRWYATNSSGANATFAQVSGTSNGAKYGSQLTFGAATSNNLAMYQVLENFNSLPAYNQTISFSCQIKAVQHITQVGITLCYETSEIKLAGSNTLASETTFTVNSSTFTTCTINSVSVGTTPTTSGVIGVKIRCTTQSGGTNIYDSGNGFVVEQAVLNIGATVGSWTRTGTSIAEERTLCQRYYSQSGDDSHVVPAASGTGSQVSFEGKTFNSGNTMGTPLMFPVEMRTAPSVTVYDLAVSPASGKIAWADNGGTETNGTAEGGKVITTRHWFYQSGGIGATGAGCGRLQFKADSEI